MFGLGTPELLLVSFIVLLLFGKKGESVRSFRKGMNEEQKLIP